MKRLVILVIEDSDITRAGVALQIGRLGLRTDEAGDGLAGFEKAMAVRPAAIIMDVHLPGISGIACTKKIRDAEGKRDLSRIPIIGFTAAEDFEVVKEDCLEAGMDVCLPKSCSSEVLYSAIDELVLLPAGFSTGSGER